MKTIICAIDYSSCSISALKYICKLNKKMNATIFAIHVYNNSSLGSDLEIPNYQLDEIVQEKQRIKLKTFCNNNIGDNCKQSNLVFKAIGDSSVKSAINLFAKKNNANLIVVGMKGIHKFKDFFIGNTTRNLIEKSICPVLAVPDDFLSNKIKTIVYATDFEKEDVFTLKDLAKIAEIFNSTIKIIHISNITKTNDLEQMEWFKELVLQQTNYKNLEFKVIFSDDILNSIHHYLEDNNADIIAMLERKKPGLINKILYSDLVKTFESFSNIPLISFNANNY